MQTPTTVSRKELHEFVWTVPGVHLAARFGLSDSGLAKICRKLNIPRPPPGWWAKKAAGRRADITPLPAQRPGIPDKITITPSPVTANGLRDTIRGEADRVGPIAVPERLTRPHPLIADWRADRRARQAEARRERDPWRRRHYAVPDFTPAERRRHRILHALFRALERQGAGIAADERGRLSATFVGEGIPFEVREKLRQVTRPLTEEEKRWETWNRSGVRTELEPTGRLQFTISAWTEQPVRKTWLESDRRSIDAMLPEIIATFTVLAPMLAERTRKREEAARRWAEEQRRAEEERQRKREDDNRWRRFLEIAGDWKRAALARDFIEALSAGGLSADELIEGRSVAEWIAWAEARAAALDPTGQGSDLLWGDVSRVTAWTYRD